MRTLCLGVMTLFVTNRMEAQTDTPEQANLAHQMTECAAYLTILSQIPGNSEALKDAYLGMADTVGSRHLSD